MSIRTREDLSKARREKVLEKELMKGTEKTESYALKSPHCNELS